MSMLIKNTRMNGTSLLALALAATLATTQVADAGPVLETHRYGCGN